jgi:hypothetical protein
MHFALCVRYALVPSREVQLGGTPRLEACGATLLRRIGYTSACIAHTAEQPSRHLRENVPRLAGQARVGSAGGGRVGNSPARHLGHVLVVFLNLAPDLRWRELP